MDALLYSLLYSLLFSLSLPLSLSPFPPRYLEHDTDTHLMRGLETAPAARARDRAAPNANYEFRFCGGERGKGRGEGGGAKGEYTS